MIDRTRVALPMPNLRSTPPRPRPARPGPLLAALASLLPVLLLLPGAAAGSTSASSTPARLRCPLKPSSTLPTGEAWSFTDGGLPAPPHPPLASSYVHGRGDWGGGHGSGTICLQETSAGASAHTIVLAVSGSAPISPGITRLGLPGVGLLLHTKVSASDDPSCIPGARGSVNLFASYHEIHDDLAQLHLGGGCGAYDYTLKGSELRVLIAREGHQVNSA